MSRCIATCAVALVLALGATSGARASWNQPGGGSSTAKAVTMPAGNTPTASASGRAVQVSWAQGTLPGAGAVEGYIVKRYDTSGNVQTIGSACSGAISAPTCTEQATPAGSWKYTVTAAQGTWRGAESAQSATVTVAAPGLSFSSSTTVTTLPTTLNGTISGFVTGQTVTFRLDNATSGTVLSGTVTPSPIPSGGSADVTVTVPAGTSNGAHTVYAVGSQGDTAGAAITVAVPSAQSLTTSAWTLSDLSSGTATDTSDYFTASGGRYLTASGFQTTYSTSRYFSFDPVGPLRPGLPVTSASFNYIFSSTTSAGSVAGGCFYFDVRRRSTGAVLATHGSTSSPVACHSAFSWSPQSTTALPEVTTTDVANDLQVRVYMTNDAAGGYSYVDLATVSVNVGADSYTLNQNQWVYSPGGSPITVPWALATADASAYASDASWDTAFNTLKYLKLTFPAYVPTGATGVSATFTHSYKSSTLGANTCWYFAVYTGTTLLATHGSATTPVSCNSTAGYVTDTVSLPEVNTVARANSIVVRVYARNSGGNNARETRHDRAVVTIGYTG